MARDSSTLQLGGAAPSFTLNSADGTPFQLDQHLPLLLLFMRGTS
jgi:hypothetical protein